MLARVTTFHIKPNHADEGARVFQEGLPAIQELEGFRDAVVLVDRARGKAMTIALWQDQQTLRSAAIAAGKLFQKAAHAIEGEPERHIYEVIEHRPGRNRKCVRVSAGTVQPSMFDITDNTIIEMASKQPGYAGFLILGNRESNMLMGMSFWDSKEHLKASEGAYYTSEMEKSRDQFEGGQWSQDVYDVAVQS